MTNLFLERKTLFLIWSILLSIVAFGVPVTSSADTVAAGQCLDSVTLNSVSIPSGQRANVLTGICEDIPLTPVVTLTINGGSNANIINGEDVDIEWFIDGNVANCSITNIGTIDVSSLPEVPVSGSLTFTPADNSETEFVLNCDGILDTVGAAFEPVVTMSIDGGTTQTADSNTGRLNYTRVRWSASNATRCELMEYQRDGIDASPRTASTRQDYSNPRGTSGWVGFDNWPNGYISGDTTFSITCENEISGAESTATIDISVLQPPPPSDVSVSMWAGSYALSRDPLTGYATTRVETRANNSTWCRYRAFEEDGVTTIDAGSVGFSHWGGHRNRGSNVRLSTTTVLEFECSRSAVTLGTTTYPAQSTSTRITIVLDPPPGEVERLLLPPVTVELIPTTSTSTVLNPFNNRGTVGFTVRARNAEYCYLRAYSDQAENTEYNLQYWTRTASNNRINGDRDTFIQTSAVAVNTSFFVECLRPFDINNFPPGTVASDNGYASTSQWIEVVPSAAAAPALETFMYANPLRYEAEDILANATTRTGFHSSTDSRDTQFYGRQSYLYTRQGAGSVNQITFPFPYASGNYTIMVAHCDEADGESNLRVEVDGSQAGTYTMDQPYGGWSGCGSLEYFVGKVADGIPITTGDPIMLECVRDFNEPCYIESVIFAQPGDVVIERTPGVSVFETEILYDSQYAESCRNQIATTQDGSTYSWVSTGWRDMAVTRNVATTTSFEVECIRNSDSASSTNSITIAIPATSSVAVGAAIATGSCLDEVTGLPIDAPAGFQANPITGVCEPAVDLSLEPPVLSLGGEIASSTAGTYDNIQMILQILNYGPGGLPDNSDISYMANITYDPVYSLPVLSSLIGDFDDDLAATGGATPTRSGLLPRVFNGVPFGTHTVCGRVNLDGTPTNYPESNPDLSNNTVCNTFTLPVPRPPMNLTVDRPVIRSGQAVNLTWDVNVTYQLACSVLGAGGVDYTFDTLVTGPYFSDTQETGPLQSTSEFVLTCTEPITGTSFTEEISVEVIPTFQET